MYPGNSQAPALFQSYPLSLWVTACLILKAHAQAGKAPPRASRWHCLELVISGCCEGVMWSCKYYRQFIWSVMYVLF